jgi:hypothetical protein
VLVVSGGLAAVVSRVSLGDFDEEGLRRNLESAEWLGEKARGHDDVLARAVGVTPLVPFRFGTVYRSEAGVREMLTEREAELEAALERLRGLVELGVKAFQLAPSPDDTEPPASGRDYLLRKQQAAQAAATAPEAARTIHERLASLAVDARANPPQAPELSGRRERMVLNGVYLVAADAQDAFASVLAELRDALAADGIELDLTGPWPPYNFTEQG